jgi:hypothetical protein
MISVLRLSLTISFLVCFSLSSTQVFAEDAHQQTKIGQTLVTLYGNDFTIDPSFVDEANEGRPHTWSSVAYFIPQLLPGIRGSEDKRSVEQTLATITRMIFLYRDLYAQGIQTLAENLEDQGHFQILEANDPISRELVDVLPYASRQDRVNALDGYIRAWFRDGTWEQRVDRYNEFKGEDVLEYYPFMNPYRAYQYFVALFHLDTVVRRSPEYAEFIKNYKPSK